MGIEEYTKLTQKGSSLREQYSLSKKDRHHSNNQAYKDQIIQCIGYSREAQGDMKKYSWASKKDSYGNILF